MPANGRRDLIRRLKFNALCVKQYNFVLQARLYLKLPRWQRVASFEWLMVASGVTPLTFDGMPQEGATVDRQAKFKFSVYEYSPGPTSRWD